MRGLERLDEGEKTRRGKETPPDPEAVPEALRWAVRWVNNSSLGNRLPDSRLEHLFRC
jgi:hypothetical protein